MKIEELARIIEQESKVRIQAASKPKGPARLPAGEFEKHYGVVLLDSRARYRPKQDQPSGVISAETCADPIVIQQAMKVEHVKPSKSGGNVRGKKRAKQFRRLTLGDISPELGKLWDD